MNDLPIKNGITIPAHELEVAASRAGGPGGQHVNKTSTRITVRWNVTTTKALTDEQRALVLTKLQSELTTEGELIVHSSGSRSQAQNKEEALERLAYKIRNALRVPKKRMKTKISASAKEKRMRTKKHHAEIKSMRKKVDY